MDDLSGLEWSKNARQDQSNRLSGQSALRPSPSPSQSGRSTPLTAQLSGKAAASNQSSARVTNGASFSGLLAPQPTRPVESLSLLERQKQLQAQKLSRTSSDNDPYGQGDSLFWEGLGSGRGTPVSVDQINKPPPAVDANDLLAGFEPPGPRVPSSKPSTPTKALQSTRQNHVHTLDRRGPTALDATNASTSSRSVDDPADDDDPFGLSQLGPTRPLHAGNSSALEDDILGDLGKPVSEVSASNKTESKSAKRSQAATASSPGDRALAELIEMGFSPDRARYALDQTSTGQDVQAAVSVLLNEAHGTSKPKSRSRDTTQQRRRSSASKRPPRAKPDAAEIPPWLNGTTRSSSRPAAQGTSEEEIDLAHQASEIGSSMWKSANSLWKTGQKRMAKAVAEFQQEASSSQPRWMQEGQPEPSSPEANRRAVKKTNGTDEAAMLDAPKQSLPPKHSSRESESRSRSSPSTRPAQRTGSALQPTSKSQQRPLSARNEPVPNPIQRVNRQAVEDEVAQAYISPARRRKQQAPPPEPKPQIVVEPQDSLDIFSATPLPQASKLARSASVPQPMSRLPSRPKPQPRGAPSTPAATLEASRRHRKAGTEAFRRGDYVAAHASYSTALNGLPSSHPVTIVLRCNRAITSIKSGDAKAAMADADAALQTIGPSNGEGESISLGGDEGDKAMREFYGKALMRKAEALEHMERWADAGKIWKDAVQAGVGGAVAIQGRNRCEKASSAGNGVNGNGMRPGTAARSKPVTKTRPQLSAMADLNGSTGRDSEAVRRLREAEAAAAKASDEAFALTDAVEARIAKWKGGKADNLRALLASLDTILWADAGWNKVGMGDLVLPNKVKIIYMKAIAKVHPDKIPQSASTEHRMISATVFAALNEAWDKFKKDNNI